MPLQPKEEDGMFRTALIAAAAALSTPAFAACTQPGDIGALYLSAQTGGLYFEPKENPSNRREIMHDRRAAEDAKRAISRYTGHQKRRVLKIVIPGRDDEPLFLVPVAQGDCDAVTNIRRD